jgi:hypothetical protein
MTLFRSFGQIIDGLDNYLGDLKSAVDSAQTGLGAVIPIAVQAVAIYDDNFPTVAAFLHRISDDIRPGDPTGKANLETLETVLKAVPLGLDAVNQLLARNGAAGVVTCNSAGQSLPLPRYVSVGTQTLDLCP